MKTFFNKYELVKYVSDQGPLDLEETLKHSGWFIVTKDGDVEYLPNLTWWLEACNRLVGTSFDIANSRKLGSMFAIYEEEKLTTQAVKALSGYMVAPLTPPAPVIDRDYIYSIKDTKEGKKELREYAAEFGVKIPASMKLENMRKKLLPPVGDGLCL